MHNLLKLLSAWKWWQAAVQVIRQYTSLFCWSLISLIFASLPKAFLWCLGKGKHNWPDSLWLILSLLERPEFTFWEKSCEICVCGNFYKAAGSTFFMTISDFVYKGQTQFYCKSLGEMLLTLIQLIQSIEAVNPACLDVHCKSSDLWCQLL